MERRECGVEAAPITADSEAGNKIGRGQHDYIPKFSPLVTCVLGNPDCLKVLSPLKVTASSRGQHTNYDPREDYIFKPQQGSFSS